MPAPSTAVGTVAGVRRNQLVPSYSQVALSGVSSVSLIVPPNMTTKWRALS